MAFIVKAILFAALIVAITGFPQLSGEVTEVVDKLQVSFPKPEEGAPAEAPESPTDESSNGAEPTNQIDNTFTQSAKEGVGKLVANAPGPN